MKTFMHGLVIGAISSAALFAQAANAEIAVVVNSGFAGNLDKGQVSQIYLGKNKSLTPVMQKGATGEEFISKALSRNASQYKAYWAKLAFTGGGRPPKELGSDADVLQQVSSNPKMIGFVDSSKVNDSVKVLFKL